MEKERKRERQRGREGGRDIEAQIFAQCVTTTWIEELREEENGQRIFDIVKLK